MKRLVSVSTLVLAVAGWVQSAYAQETKAVPPALVSYVQTDVSLGHLWNDKGELNEFLQQSGLNPVSLNMDLYSGSFKYTRNKVYWGAEFMYYTSGEKNNLGNLKTRLNGWAGEVQIGFVPICRQTFRLYPYAGLNINYNSFILKDHTPVDNLRDLFDPDRREGTVKFRNSSVNLGVQAEKMFMRQSAAEDCSQHTRYWAVGLRAGYLFSLDRGANATFNDQELAGTPSVGINGPYVKVSMGFGTKITKASR